MVYRITGNLFFASSNDLVFAFDYPRDDGTVVIDLTDAHIWDASTVAALDAITSRYADRGTAVTIKGMNPHSRLRHSRLAGHLGGH